MNKKLFKYEIIGFIFVSVLGTLFHFLYEWLGYSKVIALFCPVNESVWEHLKLLFFPYLIWTIIEYFLLNRKENFFSAKIKGVLCGNLFIVTFFYTYSGISGRTSSFIDILSFFVGTAIAFIISYEIMRNSKKDTNKIIPIIMFIAISGIFFLFTFMPPLIPLFEDPQKLTFGI